MFFSMAVPRTERLLLASPLCLCGAAVSVCHCPTTVEQECSEPARTALAPHPNPVPAQTAHSAHVGHMWGTCGAVHHPCY
jgi:hypothetical protein